MFKFNNEDILNNVLIKKKSSIFTLSAMSKTYREINNFIVSIYSRKEL